MRRAIIHQIHSHESSSRTTRAAQRNSRAPTWFGHWTFLCSFTSFFHFLSTSWLKAGRPGLAYFSWGGQNEQVKSHDILQDQNLGHTEAPLAFLSSGTRSDWNFLLGQSLGSSLLAISARWKLATCADARCTRPLAVLSGLASFWASRTSSSSFFWGVWETGEAGF